MLTGQWRCWVCAEGTKKGGGNVYTFLRLFHELCFSATKPVDYRALAEDRGLLDTYALIEWNLCKSITTDDWLIPGYNPHGQLTSLYRYVTMKDESRKLLPTPTLGHHLHGMNLWDAKKPIVFITEGPWDAIALWELLVQAKNSEGSIVPTASQEHSLYSQANVIAVPGCETFFEAWLHLFEDKIVNLLFDSDHPRKHPTTGHITEGGGYRGMRRVTEMFCNSTHKPQELNYIVWGPDGYDPKRKSGFDIRDFLTKD